MISEEMLRARKHRTELGIKRYKDRLLKTLGGGERKTIKLRIAEDEAVLERIEGALKKFNIPGRIVEPLRKATIPQKRYLAKVASVTPAVEKSSTKRRRKTPVKKDLFSLK